MICWGTGEVSPLISCPVRQSRRLLAPMIHRRSQELVQQHAPGMRQLQKGKQYSQQYLIPATSPMIL